MKYGVGFNIAHSLVWFAFHFWFNLKVVGRENLPKDEPFVVVSNHRTYADPPMINVCIKRRFCFIAKKSLFSNKAFCRLITKLGAIPSTSDDKNYSVVKRAEEILKDEKKCICIFPEGTRHKDGKVGRGHLGAALMAAELSCPVVPCGIAYKGSLHFRSKVEFRIGTPIIPKDYNLPENFDSRDLKPLRDKMMADITYLSDIENKYPFLEAENGRN